MRRIFRYGWIGFGFLITAVLIGCSKVTLAEQQSTATAYEETSMIDAKEAAEAGALAFCNIDFTDGKEAYQEVICDVATTLGCDYYREELDDNWDVISDVYNTNRLVCELVSSELIEDSEQFGFQTQIWFVRLVGTIGWEENQSNRDYWVQIANEAGEWKLNRVLSLTEINYYRQRYQATPEAQ